MSALTKAFVFALGLSIGAAAAIGTAVVAQPATGPLTPMANLMVKGDSSGNLMVNTGANTTVGSSTTFVAGTKSLTTTAAAIATTQSAVHVVVQADPDNTVDVLCGNSTTQSMQLQAAMGLVMFVTDPSLIFCKCVTGTCDVGWVGR